MIPARIGSERFKQKNLALINNKPVLAWGIEAAKKSKIFDKVIVNGDHKYFKDISKSYQVDFFERDSFLGSSSTKSDDVIIDFLKSNKCSYLIWFNAIAPLQDPNDINKFVSKLVKEDYQSLFAIKSHYVQALYNKNALNFDQDDKFQRTQDLKPVQLFVPSLMGWETASFLKKYEESGHAFFCGKTGYFEVSNLSTLVIKKETDFRLIRSVIEGVTTYYDPIEYYPK